GRPPDRRRRRPGLLPSHGRPGTGPHQRRLARGGHRRRRAAPGHRVCPDTQDVRQTNLRTPGNRPETGRDGHQSPRSASADAGRRCLLRPRRTLRHGSRHGQVLCIRGGAGKQHRIHAHPWRLRILQGIRHRAPVPRCPADLHRRGNQRNAAHHHFQAMDQKESRAMTAGAGNLQGRHVPRPAHLPLQGVRIISVEQFGAGPYGTMFLAHLGAQVIKIENAATRGDPSRQTGPFMLGPDDSQYFQSWNTNKQSVVLDIKSDEGRQAFETLAREADVVLNNLRGDQPAKLGLDYASLSRLNKALVCVHISAYGRDNPRASWPGYDYLMQAECGLMHLTGELGTPPARFGAPSIVDHMTGLTSMVGLLSSLLRARETGLGCDVDTNLFDVTLHQLGYTATWLLNEQHAAQRQKRSAHYSLTPVQTFPTADGWI